MLVKLDNVSQSFPDPNKGGRIEVLENISFSAENPSTVALLGPSGCGKSTILRLVSGMHDRHEPMPTSGSVEVLGAPVDGPHPNVLTVFQKPVLKAWLDVRGNVMLPFKASLWGKEVEAKERARRADEVIAAVGLSDFTKLKPRQLSGGMQQRVSLAARLVLRPKIMCLDEPFSALDPETRAQMQKLVLDLWRKFPCLALFVTHDVTEALRIADRIIVLSTRPATIVSDLTVIEPKPRSDQWLRSSEARGLETEIVARIRDAASAAHGTLEVEV